MAALAGRDMAHYIAPTDYVFASSSGRPANPDQLREALQRVVTNLEIKLRPREDGLHLLRHTSGSLVYRQTNSIKDTQDWLGHGSARVTLDVYTHLMQDAQKKTADTVFAPSSSADDSTEVPELRRFGIDFGTIARKLLGG